MDPMGVTDVTKSLERLRLHSPVVLRSDHGETYTIDRKTGDTYIKGDRRKDGTLRRDIRVKTGYMPPVCNSEGTLSCPQDEQAKYVPRFKREPNIAKPAYLTTETEKTTWRSRPTAPETPKWRSATPRRPSREGTTATKEQPKTDRNSSDKLHASGPTSQEPAGEPETSKHTNERWITVENPGDVKNKLKKAIKNTRQRIREAQAIKERTEQEAPAKLPQKIKRLEALGEKLKNLEAALADINERKSTKARRNDP